MTDFPQQPPGAAWPDPRTIATSVGPNPIHVGFADPAQQRRGTVLVRIILAIPQLLVLWALGIGAQIVGIIGWFAALFTGRLPDFAAEFLTGYLRWQTRVVAYEVLLTDKYPPFSFDDADYPVRLAARPGQLNRLAVFFRFILCIPAYIVAGLLIWGAYTLVLFVTWLIVLITGTMPLPLHQALAAVVRYTSRLYGYLFLLTSQYPAEFFGDPPGPDGTAGTAGVTGSEGTLLPEGQPPAFPPGPAGYPPSETGYPASPGGYPASPAGYPAATVGGPAAGWAVPGDPPWRLELSSGARKLVGLFIALGAVFIVVYVVVAVALSGGASSVVTRANAITRVQSADATLGKTLHSFATKTTACSGSGHQLRCVTNLDKQVAQAFATFGTTVRTTAMPSAAASTDASQLASAAGQAAQAFRRLGSATSVAQYQRLATGSNIQQIVDRVGQDYQRLGPALTRP